MFFLSFLSFLPFFPFFLFFSFLSLQKLYTYPNNPRAFKALIAAKYNGVELEIPAFTMGETNKSAAFLAKFPFGKVISCFFLPFSLAALPC